MAKKTRPKKTKKIGVAGKYGSRYGRKIRENVRKIEEKQKAKHKCPQCGKLSFRRISTGVWECTKCKTKAAGGAYIPQTGLGKVSQRAVQGALREEIVTAFEDEEEAKDEPKPEAKPKAKKPKKDHTKPKEEEPAPEEGPAVEEELDSDDEPVAEDDSTPDEKEAD